MATMLGMPDINTDEMTKKLEEILPVIKQVNEQFKNPVSDFLFTMFSCIMVDDVLRLIFYV